MKLTWLKIQIFLLTFFSCIVITIVCLTPLWIDIANNGKKTNNELKSFYDISLKYDIPANIVEGYDTHTYVTNDVHEYFHDSTVIFPVFFPTADSINFQFVTNDLENNNMLTIDPDNGNITLLHGVLSGNYNFQVKAIGNKEGYKEAEVLSPVYTFSISTQLAPVDPTLKDFNDFIVHANLFYSGFPDRDHVTLSDDYIAFTYIPNDTSGDYHNNGFGTTNLQGINPTPSAMSFKFEENNTNGFLKMIPSGHMSLAAGLPIGDYQFRIKATVHKNGYNDKEMLSPMYYITIN